MLHKLLRTVGTNNGVLQVSQNQGVISGLLLYKYKAGATGLYGSDEYITVTLRDETGTKVLIPRMPLSVMAQLSAIRAGMDYTLTDFVSSTSVADAGDPIEHTALIIPLGQIDLSTAELDVQITLGATGGLGTYGVYAYRGQASVDYIEYYSQTNDTATGFGECMQVFTQGEIDADRDYLVRVGEESFFVDQQGIFAMTSVNGGLSFPEEHMFQIYNSGDDIPDNVHITATGTGTTGMTMYGVHRLYNAAKVRKSVAREMNRYDKKLAAVPADVALALNEVE